MQKITIVNSKLITYLFIITLLELALMGSGQILKFGPLTVRMLLFITVVSLSFMIVLTANTIEAYFAKFLLAYSVMLFVGIFLGIVNGSEVSLLLEDLKPLFFFYILLFFSLMIKNEQSIRNVTKLLKLAALLLAVTYLGLLLLLLIGYLDFFKLYNFLFATSEVYFRGTKGFFYKGFLYMCVGIFFFFDKRSFKNILSIAIILSAVVLTFTRGFLFSILLVGFLYLIILSKKRILMIGLAILLALPSFFLISIYLDSVGDKSTSNNERLIQTQEVFERITPLNIFLGEGFGQGVPARPIHMEISFLEIFRKQGILGVSFWFVLLFAVCFSFYKADKFGNRKIALPFLLATIFVYFQTITNPFLNNPIGMSVVLISLVVLKRLETINLVKK